MSKKASKHKQSHMQGQKTAQDHGREDAPEQIDTVLCCFPAKKGTTLTQILAQKAFPSHQPMKVSHQIDADDEEQHIGKARNRAAQDLRRSQIERGDRPYEMLTPEEKQVLREQATANWRTLRGHIRAMRLKANFLVTFLDDENEMKQENMYGEGDKHGGAFEARAGEGSVAP